MLRIGRWYVVIAVIAVADQILKQLVIDSTEARGGIPVIDGVLDITYVQNFGAAFDSFEGQGRVLAAVASVLVVVLIVLVTIYGKKRAIMLPMALSLTAGGGLGNAIDRIWKGYVVDYIDVNFFSFPVFNLADICVCAGVALIVIYTVRYAGR